MNGVNPYQAPEEKPSQPSEQPHGTVAQRSTLGARLNEAIYAVVITVTRVKLLQFLLVVLDDFVPGKSTNLVQRKLALIFVFLLLMSHVRDAFGVAPFRSVIIALFAYVVALTLHLRFGA